MLLAWLNGHSLAALLFRVDIAAFLRRRSNNANESYFMRRVVRYRRSCPPQRLAIPILDEQMLAMGDGQQVIYGAGLGDASGTSNRAFLGDG